MDALITRIQPSIIAKDSEELRTQFHLFPIGFKVLHLDAMVPPSVKNKSLFFPDMQNLTIGSPDPDVRYALHIMSEDPLTYFNAMFPQNLAERTDTVIVHYEIAPRWLSAAMTGIKTSGKRFGLAIKPETRIGGIISLLKDERVDEVLVMTVHPGQYGAQFLEKPLEKVAQIREVGFEGVIGIDGGANPGTMGRIARANPHYAVVGSCLQKAQDKLGAARDLQDYFKD